MKFLDGLLHVDRVDRLTPHIFSRDYHMLHPIPTGVVRFLARHGAELRGGNALDFGAGFSPYAPLFEKAGMTLLRADIDPKSPEVLKISDDGHVPVEDGSIDAVLSTQVLEHVPDVLAYLREAWRMLRPGGLLYLTTHGAYIQHSHPSDMRRWMIDGLRYEMEQTGFVVEEIEPKVGIVAYATFLRSVVLGGFTHKIPLAHYLRPILYFLANLRMSIEERLTPRSIMATHPGMLLATARKPKQD